jgi:hypothetical protein
MTSGMIGNLRPSGNSGKPEPYGAGRRWACDETALRSRAANARTFARRRTASPFGATPHRSAGLAMWHIARIATLMITATLYSIPKSTDSAAVSDAGSPRHLNRPLWSLWRVTQRESARAGFFDEVDGPAPRSPTKTNNLRMSKVSPLRPAIELKQLESRSTERARRRAAHGAKTARAPATPE